MCMCVNMWLAWWHTMGCPVSENLTLMSCKCLSMGSSCSYNRGEITEQLPSKTHTCMQTHTYGMYTCSISLSRSTFLNTVSQNSGIPLGSSFSSSFFSSSTFTLSLRSLWVHTHGRKWLNQTSVMQDLFTVLSESIYNRKWIRHEFLSLFYNWSIFLVQTPFSVFRSEILLRLGDV